MTTESREQDPSSARASRKSRGSPAIIEAGGSGARERPILFSAPMVRALGAGTKTQTRRKVKNPDYYACLTGDCPHQRQDECAAFMALQSPYGVAGDVLWVREACRAEELSRPQQVRAATRREREALGRTTVIELDGVDGADGVRYPADDEWRGIENTPEAGEAWSALYHYDEKRRQPGSVVPAIHMPRWASRITLRVTDVRVERLQDISERDARREGLQVKDREWMPQYRGADDLPWCVEFPRDAYQDLWNHINGPGSWDANPWVWAVSFERALSSQHNADDGGEAVHSSPATDEQP